MSSSSGQKGEQYTAAWLEGEGVEILRRNYHSRYGEVDIIARDQHTIRFVEVKTRRQGSMVSGEAAVTKAKQRKIIRTALLYLQEFPLDLQPRFDVCTVLITAAGDVISHEYLEAAFDGSAYEYGVSDY